MGWVLALLQSPLSSSASLVRANTDVAASEEADQETQASDAERRYHDSIVDRLFCETWTGGVLFQLHHLCSFWLPGPRRAAQQQEQESDSADPWRGRHDCRRQKQESHARACTRNEMH